MPSTVHCKAALLVDAELTRIFLGQLQVKFNEVGVLLASETP